MKEEYQLILTRGIAKHAANVKFLKNLASKKVKGLYKIIHQFHAEVFSEIDCMQCANCCRTLGPLLNETDINRIAPLFRMRKSVFEEKYLIIDEDGDRIFKSMPCPFLGTDERCSVYDDRPKACKGYPHTEEKNIEGKLPKLGINTEFCPGAVLIVEKLKERFPQL